jgi:hypothetical protein
MNNEKLVSPYIPAQFPFHYRENYPQFVEFVKMYYTWLEQGDQAIGHAKRLQEYRDIDETPEDYIQYFKSKYLPYLNFVTEVDKRTLVKHVQDLYRSKGTDRGVDLFFRLVYGVPAEIYYPATDLFRLSDNEWIKRNYLEIGHIELINDFVGKKITGTRSGATAFAEKFVQKKVGNTYVNLLFISNIVGNFMYNEKLTYDGLAASDRKRPRIVGSLSRLDVTAGSVNFRVGDVVTVTSENGHGALARVANVFNSTGLVDFNLDDGGWGYTSNSTVYVSDKVMTIKDVTVDYTVNNPDKAPYRASSYFLLEEVYQPLANLNYRFDSSRQYILVQKPSGTWYSVGATLYQVDGTSTNSSVGVVISNSSVNSTTQNLVVLVDKVDITHFDFSTTAGDFSNVYLSTNSLVNSIILDANASTNIATIAVGTVLRSYNSTGGVISSVEVVDNEIANLEARTANLFVYVDSGNTQTNTYFWSPSNTFSINVSAVVNRTASGNVIAFSNTATLHVSNSTTNFEVGQFLTQRRLYTGGYDISARGKISGITGTANTFTVLLADTTGVFRKTVNVHMQFANGVESSQTAYLDSYDGYIGVANITNDFISTGNNRIYTRGYTYDGNGEMIIRGSNTVANLVALSTGKNATFEISDVFAYAETYSLYTDFVGANNQVNVPFMDLRLSNSTTYSNSLTLSFTSNSTSNTNALLVARYGSAVAGSFTSGNVRVLNTNTSSFTVGQVVSVYTNSTAFTISNVATITNSTSMNLSTTASFTGTANIYLAGTSTINTSINWWVSGAGLGDFNELVSVPNSTHITVTTNSSSNSSGNYYLTPTDGIPWYFPKNQAGAIQWIIGDVLSDINGFVGGLTKIVAENPGEDYNIAPMVLVREPFVAGFNAKDYVITYANTAGNFAVGEQITQNNGAVGLIKQIVTSVPRVMYVRRQNLPLSAGDGSGLTTQFTLGEDITGSSSGATATIVGISEDDSALGIGLNAEISTDVVTGNGIVGAFEILASGFGFENDENATFLSEDGLRAGTAKVKLIKEGVTDGSFNGRSSFLSDNKYLFDGDYYQEFSYDIKTSIPRETYLDNFNSTMHLAGTKMFSTYVLTSVNDVALDISLPESANLVANVA